MIDEMRTCTAHPGRLGSWLPVFEQRRLPLLLEHLGHLVGAFTPGTDALQSQESVILVPTSFAPLR